MVHVSKVTLTCCQNWEGVPGLTASPVFTTLSLLLELVESEPGQSPNKLLGHLPSIHQFKRYLTVRDREERLIQCGCTGERNTQQGTVGPNPSLKDVSVV